MKLVQLSEDESYDRLDEPYNPPLITEEFTEEHFTNEWHNIRDKLKSFLEQFGEHDDYGDKDFNLGETLTLSRGIGLELTSKKMMNKRLLPETQKLLCDLPQKYEIDFAVMTEDGIFHIFVDCDFVRYWCPKSVARKLGV